MKRISITLLIAAIALLAACKKDNTGGTGTLYLHMHTNIDTTEAEAGVVCHDAAGRQYQLNVAQFYVSNVKLHRANGTSLGIDGVYALKTIATEQYLVGEVPVGDYVSVTFNVGLDSTINHSDPATYNPSSVLAPQNPSMWFGSTTQGYVFMRVEGLADTTLGNVGTPNVPFSYLLGTDAQRKTITMPDKAFTVTKGTAQEIHITCDYGKLLTGIDFKTQTNATPFVNPATATQIANNISNMFSYEE